MRPFQSVGIPINPVSTAFISTPASLKGSSLRGLRGSGCGCGPAGGCQCYNPGVSAYDPGRGVFAPGPVRWGMRGLGQNASLDQIIANTFSWVGGIVQTNLPASAAVPPQYGSTGAIGTQIMQWAPYLLIGYLAYKVIK
jgi:hypothetical protein